MLLRYDMVLAKNPSHKTIYIVLSAKLLGTTFDDGRLRSRDEVPKGHTGILLILNIVGSRKHAMLREPDVIMFDRSQILLMALSRMKCSRDCLYCQAFLLMFHVISCERFFFY